MYIYIKRDPVFSVPQIIKFENNVLIIVLWSRVSAASITWCIFKIVILHLHRPFGPGYVKMAVYKCPASDLCPIWSSNHSLS